MIKFIFIAGLGVGDLVGSTAYLKSRSKHKKNDRLILVTDSPLFFENLPVFKVWVIRNRLFLWLSRNLISFLGKLGGFCGIYGYKSGVGTLEELKNENGHYVDLASRHLRDFPMHDYRGWIIFSDNELNLFSQRFNDLPENFGIIHSTGKSTITDRKNVGVSRLQKIVDSCTSVTWLQIGAEGEPLLNDVYCFVGKTRNFRELAYVISQASFVVCQEGGYNHIAAAFNISTIMLCTGYLDPKFFMYPTTYLVRNDVMPKCAPCARPGLCENDHICVSDDLVDQAVDLLRHKGILNEKSVGN